MQETPQSRPSGWADRWKAWLERARTGSLLRPLVGLVVLVAVFLGSYLYFQGWTGLSGPQTALDERPNPEEVEEARGTTGGTVSELPAPGEQTAESEAPETAQEDVPAREVAGTQQPAFGWPVPGAKTVTGFGWQYSETMGDWRWHPGVDLAVASGTPVAAAADGRVVRVDRDDDHGLTVTLEHDGDYRSTYASLSEAAVEAGQAVRRGQTIGTVGRSARTESTVGDHVHFEIWRGDEAVDPAGVIPSQ